MKTFKQFINEGVIDYLQGKSKDDMIKALDGLSDNDKIEKIIKYKLNYNLLPRNDDGICVYEGDLNLYDNQLTKLPDNLTIKGDLNCGNNQLTELPDNLTVNGWLGCSHNKLTKLPDNLTLNGSLYCGYNQLTELLDNLTVNGNFNCSYNQLTSLPYNLTVKGDLYCNNNKVKLELLEDSFIGGKFIN